MQSLFGAQLNCAICASAGYTRYFGCTSVYLWTSLFTSQYLCGTIFPTLYSKVWEWRVWEQGKCFFIGLICSLPFCLLLFFLSPLSFDGLVLSGCGLRTDRVSIVLHGLAFPTFFMIIIITCMAETLIWIFIIALKLTYFVCLELV